MALFKYIETIFFVSLGITFVLILMLVYHFKDRISHLEQKLDTMFDIMNNVVKEMIVIKTQSQMTSYSTQDVHNVYIPNTISNPISPESFLINTSVKVDKIVVSDNDADDEDDDLDDDEDDDLDDDEDDDDDLDDDDDVDEDYLENKDVADDRELGEDILDIEIEKEDSLVDLKIESIPLEKPSEYETLEDLEKPSEENRIKSVLETSITEEVDNMEITIHTTEHKNYRKMDVPALRALIVDKKCMTDTSKMKKKDLIELLSKL
jgi:hypothetical protein